MKNMRNRNWNHEFPEVPEHVHKIVLSTLAELEDGKVKKVKQMKKGKIAILIAAIAAVLGMTVSAAEIFKWNKRAAEVFVADEAQQEELVAEQIAKEEYQTISDAGLTIRAIQTIQDNNCFYALFEVVAEDESVQITEDCSMGVLFDYQGEEDPFCALSWGFVGERQQAVSNSRYYEIYGTKAEPGQEDLHMKIQFTSLNAPGAKAMDGEPVLEGKWEFLLDLHNTEPVRYEINNLGTHPAWLDVGLDAAQSVEHRYARLVDVAVGLGYDVDILRRESVLAHHHGVDAEIRGGIVGDDNERGHVARYAAASLYERPFAYL